MMQVERKSNLTEGRLNALVKLYSRRYHLISPEDHRTIIETFLTPYVGVTDLKRIYAQKAEGHGAELTLSDFFGIESDLLDVPGGEPVFQRLIERYYPRYQTQ